MIAASATLAATDRDAEIARLFATYGRAVWRFLRHAGVRDADVDDVCQEVFVVAHRRWDDYQDRGAERAWLYGIAARCAAAHRRTAHVRREVASGDALPEGGGTGPGPDAGAADARRMLARLESLLRSLDPVDRDAFVLFAIEGLPMAEVAAALQCALPTAYARCQRAREAIRLRLGGDHER